MFAKLLKYELRSSKWVMSLLCIVTVGLFLVGAIALKSIIVGFNQDFDFNALLVIAGVPTLMMCAIGVIACFVLTQVLLVAQFYKSKFTDEGYLTFTLPTNVHNIYLSSLLNFLIWEAVIFTAIVAGVTLFSLFGTAAEGLVNLNALSFDWVGEIIGFYAGGLGFQTFDWVVIFLRAILSIIASCVLYTACITIGATVSKRRKVLVAIGIYFGVNSAVSIITNIATFSVWFLADYMTLDTTTVWDLGSAVQALLHVVIIVGGYLLTTHLMKKKLNLA